MSKPFAYWSRLLTVSTLAVCLSFNPAMAGQVLKRILSKRCQTACQPTNCFSDPCDNPCPPACPPVNECSPCDGGMTSHAIVSVPECGCAIPAAPITHGHSHSSIQPSVMPSVITPIEETHSDHMDSDAIESSSDDMADKKEMDDMAAEEVMADKEEMAGKEGAMEKTEMTPPAAEIEQIPDNSSTDLAPPPAQENESPFAPLEDSNPEDSNPEDSNPEDSDSTDLEPPVQPADPNGNGVDDLFGGGDDAAPSTGGGTEDLFNTDEATPAQPPADSDYLFGNPPAAAENTGDLFSDPPAPSDSTGDLFGDQPTNDTTDLFGDQPAADTPAPPPADAGTDDLFGTGGVPADEVTPPADSAAPSSDLFGGGDNDLFGDQPTTPPPAENVNPLSGDNAQPADDLFGDGDLFTDPPASEPAAPANPNPGTDLDDLFDGGAPVSAPVQADSELDALFDNPTNLEVLPDPEPAPAEAAPSEAAPSFNRTNEDSDDTFDEFDDLFSGAVRRTWTDNTGNFKVEAQLAEVFPDKVRLLKANGKFATVPVNRLSERDLSYVQWVVAQIDTDSARLVAQK